jgi:hypothetical protein
MKFTLKEAKPALTSNPTDSNGALQQINQNPKAGALGPRLNQRPLGRPPIGDLKNPQPGSMQAQLKQADASQKQADAASQAPSTQPEQPPAQPTATPAKPEDKAKQDEKAKEKFARLWNFGFFKSLTASSPEMAKALMGVTSKAQQYAGTPKYIPVLRQGFINAGVPKAEAEKAAREAAKVDQQVAPTQQQPAAPNQVEPAQTSTPDSTTAAAKSAAEPAAIPPEVAASSVAQSTQPSNQQTTEIPDVSSLPVLDRQKEEEIFSKANIEEIDTEYILGDVYDSTAGKEGQAKLLKFKSEDPEQPLYIIAKNEQGGGIIGFNISKDRLSNFIPKKEALKEALMFRKSTRGIFVLKG